MLNAIDYQRELLIRHAAQEPDLSAIVRQTTLLAAINLCCSISGLTDKQIYMELEIDAGQWARIKSGQAHLPPNKLEQLMDLCGNEIPLIWLAHKRGYGLQKLQTKLEQELELERAKTLELERKLEHMAEFMKMSRG